MPFDHAHSITPNAKTVANQILKKTKTIIKLRDPKTGKVTEEAFIDGNLDKIEKLNFNFTAKAKYTKIISNYEAKWGRLGSFNSFPD